MQTNTIYIVISNPNNNLRILYLRKSLIMKGK